MLALATVLLEDEISAGAQKRKEIRFRSFLDFGNLLDWLTEAATIRIKGYVLDAKLPC